MDVGQPFRFDVKSAAEKVAACEKELELLAHASKKNKSQMEKWRAAWSRYCRACLIFQQAVWQKGGA